MAPSTLSLRGIAVSVVRIMPVLYSPLIASTARMATTAWLRSTPDRATLAGSCPQPAAWQLTAEAAPTPTAAVSAMTREQQPPGSGQRAQLGPLRAQRGRKRSGTDGATSGANLEDRSKHGNVHASLRFSVQAARARATAAQAQSTAKPAHGASG